MWHRNRATRTVGVTEDDSWSRSPATDEDAKAVVADDDEDDKDADATKAEIAKELRRHWAPGRLPEGNEESRRGTEEELGPGLSIPRRNENLGVELNKELGPDRVEKQMKNRARSWKSNSVRVEFEKGMKAKGKEFEGKFGPGSDFEKRMKRFGEEWKRDSARARNSQRK